MKIELTATEARVIGCLLEKQVTTPDQYPLSINALTNACNQKSNRDPVLALAEDEVRRTIDTLSRKHLVIERSGFGSRVPKYQQNFCNTEYGTLKFTPVELGIVCELLLRGPQTPGELRSRVPRMAAISDADGIESALQTLATREAGPVVVRLAREPGRRDACWAQLFTGPIAAAGPADAAPLPAQTSPPSPPSDERLSRLEDEVRALRAAVEELERRGQ